MVQRVEYNPCSHEVKTAKSYIEMVEVVVNCSSTSSQSDFPSSLLVLEAQ